MLTVLTAALTQAGVMTTTLGIALTLVDMYSEVYTKSAPRILLIGVALLALSFVPF